MGKGPRKGKKGALALPLPPEWVKKLHLRGKADLVTCSEEVLGWFLLFGGGCTPDPPHWSLFSATAPRRNMLL